MCVGKSLSKSLATWIVCSKIVEIGILFVDNWTYWRAILYRQLTFFYACIIVDFCYIDEIGAATTPYCDRSCSRYKCKPRKSYHGRGPIQLTWNCNYGACGKYLGLDLLNRPELASSNPTVSFKTALWYWMTRVHSRMNRGFGATIRAINGGECGGNRPTAVKNRVKYYRKYCKKFGVTPGPNISC